MLELKRTDKERVVMYGFDSVVDTMQAVSNNKVSGNKIIFYGSRENLIKNRKEGFWWLVVKKHKAMFEHYGDKDLVFCDAWQSGHSAIEKVPGNYFLIVRERG